MTNNSDTLSMSSSEDLIDAFTTLFDLEVAIDKIKSECEKRRSGNEISGADAISFILPMIEAVRNEASPEAITAVAKYRKLQDENHRLLDEINNLKNSTCDSPARPAPINNTDYRDSPLLNIKHKHHSPKLSAIINCWFDLFQNNKYSDGEGIGYQVGTWLIENRPDIAFHQHGQYKGKKNQQAINQIVGVLTYRAKNPH